VLSLLAVSLLVGCQPAPQTVRFPVRPKMYRTVASLSPGSTEVVASLSYNLGLVGRTAACNYPPNVLQAPIVAQVKPDYEKLKKAAPGIVVYDASLFSDQDIAEIKKLGIDTFEFKAKTIQDFAQEVLKFGSLVGSEMESSAYADKMLQERSAAMAKISEPAPKVALIMPGQGGEHLIAGTKSFQADVIRSSGGAPVGPDQDKFVPIDAEALIQLNPDMIITAGNPDPLMADPRLKTLPAIAKLKVRGIEADLAIRMGFRVDKEIGLVNRSIMDMLGRK
jgi:iron complex transport system substrate-binding protein